LDCLHFSNIGEFLLQQKPFGRALLLMSEALLLMSDLYTTCLGPASILASYNFEFTGMSTPADKYLLYAFPIYINMLYNVIKYIS